MLLLIVPPDRKFTVHEIRVIFPLFIRFYATGRRHATVASLKKIPCKIRTSEMIQVPVVGFLRSAARPRLKFTECNCDLLALYNVA